MKDSISSAFLEILQSCKINERRINMRCKITPLHFKLVSINEGRIKYGNIAGERD